MEDEELRELLKNNGIGRPSTRANIIETLLKENTSKRKGKIFFMTQTGIDLIDTIEDELLKSAELMGDWEQNSEKLKKANTRHKNSKKNSSKW